MTRAARFHGDRDLAFATPGAAECCLLLSLKIVIIKNKSTITRTLVFNNHFNPHLKFSRV